MVQCKHCNGPIRAKDDNVLKCKGPCGCAFHKKCVKEGRLMDATNYCAICQAAPKNPEENKILVDLNLATPQEVLAKVNEKLEMLFHIQKALRELADSVDFYAA
ncbi:hypothetical protein O0L34_g19303 [Tuta absoluta]|nr:hypothetical protein O0L34_g19303 [Tuta absoluta]